MVLVLVHLATWDCFRGTYKTTLHSHFPPFAINRNPVLDRCFAIKCENMKRLLIFILVVAVTAEEKKWVWDGEGKAGSGDNRNVRYGVHEYPEDGVYPTGGHFAPQNQFRPQYPGPYGPNSRPIGPGEGTQVLVGPDGPSGIGNRPFRPSGGGYDYNLGPVVPGANVDPLLSGPVPSWVRNDPRYQEYDACKCSRGFNCPGVKFGSCARGKQYCCFNSRKYPGARPGYQQHNENYVNRPYPSGGGGVPFPPFNAIPPEYYENGNNNYDSNYNGNYYGQYNNGGYGRPHNNYNRPYYGNNGNNYDGHYQGPYSPDYTGGFDWQDPYRRRPYDNDYYGRSNGKNKNANDKTANDVSTSSSTITKSE